MGRHNPYRAGNFKYKGNRQQHKQMHKNWKTHYTFKLLWMKMWCETWRSTGPVPPSIDLSTCLFPRCLHLGISSLSLARPLTDLLLPRGLCVFFPQTASPSTPSGCPGPEREALLTWKTALHHRLPGPPRVSRGSAAVHFQFLPAYQVYPLVNQAWIFPAVWAGHREPPVRL